MENTVVDPKVLALAEKIALKKEQEAKDRVEAIRTKYPHAKADTLSYDAGAGKFSVEIICTKCGAEGRRVFTSDLFQVRSCTECTSTAKAEKKALKKAALKEALELLKNRGQ